MSTATPRLPIRRFDIFAEWNRLKGKEKLNLNDADAETYGLAVATIVAARKFSGHQPGLLSEWKKKARQDEDSERDADAWWRHLGTPEKFGRTVIQRMGEPFYH